MQAADAPFEGFRTGARAATFPAQFFTEVLPTIDDPVELRVTVYALYAIPRPGRPLAAMRGNEIAAEEPMARWFAHRGGGAAVRAGLDAAVARGVLLSLPLEDGDALYLVHNDAGRRLRDRIASGAAAVPNGVRVRAVDMPAPSRPAQVYEQEIGLITPTISTALAEAVERTSAAWVVDAIRLAATRNARSWRYAEAILRRWETEGRDDEGAERPAGGRPADPYAALVRRTYDD